MKDTNLRGNRMVFSRASKENVKLKRNSTNWVMTFFAAALGLIFFIPALWMVIGSFRPTEEIYETMSEFNWGLLIPSQISFDNYAELMNRLNFDRALWVSAYTTFWTVMMGLGLSILAAYALGVLNFRGR
jgi:ABC-type glycerol-3-phosphate transport system permease component